MVPGTETFKTSGGRIFGGVVLVGACLFLAWQINGVWAKLSEVSISIAFIGMVTIASIAYTGLLSLLALAWWRLVQVAVPEKLLPVRECWRIFMRMQAPKYLPGNIFQYLGRVELLGRRGVSRQAAVLSLVQESALLATVALLLGAGGLSQATLALGELKARFMVIAVICLVGLIVLWTAHRYRVVAQGGARVLGGSWLAAAALYAVFFLSMAGVLWLLGRGMGHALPAGLCLAAATVPWLLGFITPGSPGGLGVREAVMLILLKPVMLPVDALLLVMAMRLITLFGDLLALPLSYLPLRHEDEAR